MVTKNIEVFHLCKDLVLLSYEELVDIYVALELRC